MREVTSGQREGEKSTVTTAMEGHSSALPTSTRTSPFPRVGFSLFNAHSDFATPTIKKIISEKLLLYLQDMMFKMTLILRCSNSYEVLLLETQPWKHLVNSHGSAPLFASFSFLFPLPSACSARCLMYTCIYSRENISDYK